VASVTAQETLQSPLHEVHVALGAKITPFGGWDMPLQYEGVLAEHRAVRERAGLFDVSHLGKLAVRGPGAGEFLDGFLPGKVAALGEWRAGYNLVLNDRAGIVDDIFVYRRPDTWLLVPNAGNTLAVAEVLRNAAPEGGSGEVAAPGAEQLHTLEAAIPPRSVKVEDARFIWAILALQGPASREVAAGLFPEANELSLHAFGDFEVDGVEVQIARTGYAGEYGFELFVPWDDAVKIWDLVLREGEPFGVVPAGLGARDTLRLEMGYPLHGHELTADTNPIEAGLDWVIDWSKEFEGKELLLKIKERGVERKLAGLVMAGREIPRAGYSVYRDGLLVGELSSGNFSPVLGKGIALGYLAPSAATEATMLEVEVRGRRVQATVVRPPFTGKKKI
jgi:glycine cleavage system T protein (aminomethyltransferase)